MLTESCGPERSRDKHGCIKTALKMQSSSFIYLIVKTTEASARWWLTASGLSTAVSGNDCLTFFVQMMLLCTQKKKYSEASECFPYHSISVLNIILINKIASESQPAEALTLLKTINN